MHRRASVRGRRGRRRPAADARLRRDQEHARDVRRDARGRARACAAVLRRARRGRGGGARDGRGGSTLPRGRGGGQRGGYRRGVRGDGVPGLLQRADLAAADGPGRRARRGARAAAVAAAGGAELPVRVRAGDVRRGRGRRVRG